MNRCSIHDTVSPYGLNKGIESFLFLFVGELRSKKDIVFLTFTLFESFMHHSSIITMLFTNFTYFLWGQMLLFQNYMEKVRFRKANDVIKIFLKFIRNQHFEIFLVDMIFFLHLPQPPLLLPLHHEDRLPLVWSFFSACSFNACFNIGPTPASAPGSRNAELWCTSSWSLLIIEFMIFPTSPAITKRKHKANTCWYNFVFIFLTILEVSVWLYHFNLKIQT